MAARTQSAFFYAGSGSGTSYTIPGTGNIASIAAGSLVRFYVRYEGGAQVSLSATDSAGATYTVVAQHSDGPTVAVLYKHNHPGGTNVTITVSLGASRSYIESCGQVMSGTVGEGDPLTGTYGTYTDTSVYTGPTTVTSVGGDASLFMVIGSYSSTTIVGSGGSTALHNDVFTLYSNAVTQARTGTGDKTISATGGAGPTRALAVAFLDDGGGGGGSSSVPPPFPRFNNAILNH